MNEKARSFFATLSGKRVSLIGVGVSNTELAKLLCARGAAVTVRDRRGREQLGAVGGELERAGARLTLGEDYLRDLGPLSCDVVIRAPGVYFLSDYLTKLRAQGVVVTSEMELFFDLCPCPTFAVTGSDGKTTTTSVIARMLEQAGYTVHLGGNIGRALLPLVEEMNPGDRAVVELSSFQLLSMRCAPDVSVVTNVTPNHLDVHGDMKEYISAKRGILLHQGAFSKTVLNFDNDITRAFSAEVRGRLMGFSRRERPDLGAYVADDGGIYLRERGGEVQVMRCDDIRLPGMHNVENYMAAVCAVSDFVTPEQMRQVACTFGGVEHRIEFVRQWRGVRWYNDSIATSPSRTIAGLQAFGQRLVVIAGGSDKKVPYLPLAPELCRNAKVLILMGATADKIEQAVTTHPAYDPSALRILRADGMDQAVRLASEAAKEGDVVTLSPASASFDQYPNFEARGEHFKSLVNALD